jgi:hypothetical protein
MKWLLGVACALAVLKIVCDMGTAPTVVPLRIRMEDLRSRTDESDDPALDATDDPTLDPAYDDPDPFPEGHPDPNPEPAVDAVDFGLSDLSVAAELARLADLAAAEPLAHDGPDGPDGHGDTVNALAATVVEESWTRRRGSGRFGRALRAVVRRLTRGCRK